VPAYPGCAEKVAVKQMSMCVYRVMVGLRNDALVLICVDVVEWCGDLVVEC